MPWSAIIPAAGAAIGGIMGGLKSGGGTQTTDNAPWSAQQPYMTYGFDQAKQILQDRQNNPLPAGPWIAPETDMQNAAVPAIYNTGMGAPDNFAPWTSAGSTLASGAPAFLSNASDMASNGVGNADPAISELMKTYALTGNMPGAAPVNGDLTNSVTGAATNGLASLSNGQQLANSVGAAGMNPQAGTNFAIQTAGSVAANPLLDAQIDEVNRDVERNLGENTLRGIAQNASLTGGANSSRTGALQAIATRGAQDEMADNAATIRGAAYNNGLNLGGNLYSTGLNSSLGAASALNTNGGIGGSLAAGELSRETGQNQFDTSSQLGAAGSANASDLGWATGNAAAKTAGNAQIGSGLGIGQNASMTGLNGTLSGQNAALSAGGYQQNQNQLGINNTLDMWQAQDQRPQSLLQDYWNIVGKPMGSQSASTYQPNNGGLGGMLSGAAGGASAGYGLYQNFFGGNSQPLDSGSWNVSSW